MIETYRQTLLQLFICPHQKRFSKEPPSILEMIPQTIIESSLFVYLCQENGCVLTEGAIGNINQPIGKLSLENNDNLLQVKATNSSTKLYFNLVRPDRVTCCEFVPGLDILFLGGSSGILNV